MHYMMEEGAIACDYPYASQQGKGPLPPWQLGLQRFPCC